MLLALAVTFVIQFAEKSGYRDWAIDRTDGLLRQMLQCDFCLGFWTSLAFSIILAFILGHWWLVFMPAFTTPIIRYLIN